MTKTLVNGECIDTININDRGLQYGDGLFETMAVHNGKIPLWESHWQRLCLGCKKLSINLPNKNIIESEIKSLCNENNDTHFVIKLIITRGSGKRGYGFTKEQSITRILSLYDWPNYDEHFQTNGVAVRFCESTLSENTQLSEIKHLNRLEQIMARNEWNDSEFQEGLMSTSKGYVVDGTMSNVFAVQDNMIFTPDLSLCGVAGVMRKTVINIAKEKGFAVYEKNFTKSELEMADELFLTNSLFGIWPIKRIFKTRFTKVGTVTKQLQKEVNILCQ